MQKRLIVLFFITLLIPLSFMGCDRESLYDLTSSSETSDDSSDESCTISFSLEEGVYNSDISIELSTETEDAEIRYTINESEPTTESTVYSGPITVSPGTIYSLTMIKAIVVLSGEICGEAAEASYETSGTTVMAPFVIFEDDPDNENLFQVKLLTAPEDGTIYYTTDGTDPSTSSTEYSDVFPMGTGSSFTIKTYAVYSGMADSSTTTAEYDADTGEYSVVTE
ncbi:MAG: hypothetical protein GY754_12875 [bacterium]|nr:hypothetical protein [bacterium]